jgi:hypothetical protein
VFESAHVCLRRPAIAIKPWEGLERADHSARLASRNRRDTHGDVSHELGRGPTGSARQLCNKPGTIALSAFLSTTAWLIGGAAQKGLMTSCLETTERNFVPVP